MGVWDSIKGGVGSAWDQTGGQVWDAHQRANEDERLFGLNPDKGLYQALEGVTDFAKGYGNLLYDLSPMGMSANIAGWLPGQFQETQTEPVISGPTIYGPGVVQPTSEQFEAANESLLSFEEGQGPSTGMDPFARPGFDPTAITGPYGAYTAAANQAFDEYTALLEGISTGPRTSRIDEMYAMALAEATRRGESADTWEATQGARLESDFAAREEQLSGLHEAFNVELDLIREASGERREGAVVEREARIDQMIADADLGEAAATFIVSSTKTSDILDSQGTRQEVYDGRMDRLYAGWELDRTMDLAGLESGARRDLADEVLAMKGLVDKFRYEAGQQRLGQLFVAEEGAAQRETDMLTTLAELGYGHAGRMADVGLQGALAVAGAEDEFDTKWDRAEAYWENPVTANAFFGMDPSMMGGADPSEFVDYWLAIQQMQAGAAGEDVGPLLQDPAYGAYWADAYTIDPATGLQVFDPSVMTSISGAIGMAPSDLLSNVYAPPGT